MPKSIIIRLSVIAILAVLIYFKTRDKKFDYEGASDYLCKCVTPIYHAQKEIKKQPSSIENIAIINSLTERGLDCLSSMKKKFGENYDIEEMLPFLKEPCPELYHQLEETGKKYMKADSIIHEFSK